LNVYFVIGEVGGEISSGEGNENCGAGEESKWCCNSAWRGLKRLIQEPRYVIDFDCIHCD